MEESNVPEQNGTDDRVRLTADIVAAYVSHNQIPPADIPKMIRSVFETLGGMGDQKQEAEEPPKPAVPVKKSVTPDYIVCLEDGKKLKMLKRYLRTQYDMSPEEYRQRWNLPADYPMVAPNYAQQRSEWAKKIGLGRPAAKGGKGGRRKNSGS